MAGERLSLGQLVTSRAGRDRGRPFLVVGFEGDRYALVADGDLRKVDRPKKKNLRHLVSHGRTARAILQKLETGQAVQNAELRAALAELTRELGDGGHSDADQPAAPANPDLAGGR